MSALRAIVLLVAMAVSLPACQGADRGATASGGPASASAAERFLADYVTSDGRVIRHDQGG